MTLDETAKLVRFLAALDGRKVTNDVIHAHHQMLAQHTYLDAKRAAETAARNTRRDHTTIAEILAVLNGQAARAGQPTYRTCAHGVTKPAYCHDCTHTPNACELCAGGTQ